MKSKQLNLSYDSHTTHFNEDMNIVRLCLTVAITMLTGLVKNEIKIKLKRIQEMK